MNKQEYTYDVALSFAGEQRTYVKRVAAALEAAGVRCFFDERAAVEMWGENLPEYLDRVYRLESRYVVVFVSADYIAKVWTRVEFRSAVARAIEQKSAYVLPVRLDDTELPGLLPTVQYLDARRLAPEQVAQAVLEKLGRAQPSAPEPASVRVPRVTPENFNPYAETEIAVREIKEILGQRARQMPSGLVGHAEDRGGRFILRILRSGRPVYSLDMFVGGGFGDNTICFYGRTGGSGHSDGSSNAHGTVEWDREQGRPIVRLSNMSMLPEMGREYRFTPGELAEEIWNEACDQIERDAR